MKTKLLRKVRCRFEINYYPNLIYPYQIKDNRETHFSLFERLCIEQHYKTKQDALNGILTILRYLYGSKTRKYKQSQIHTKVWYK